MNKQVYFFLPAALCLAACSSLPLAEKIQRPSYLSVNIDSHETLGEFLVVTPSFKIVLPETTRERTTYLETRVAEFDRMKLFKGSRFGADRTVRTNDLRAVNEQLAREGRAVKITPETLTISAKLISGKIPRVVLTATPNILDEDGTLHFSLDEKVAPGGLKNTAESAAKAQAARDAEAAAEAAALPPGKKAASIRAYLQGKYGKTVMRKKSGTVPGAGGKPAVAVETELTFFLETARVTFNGTVRNLGQQKIWATYFLPQLTYRKGRDWFTFTARQFAESVKGGDKNLYLLAPGAEKKFQFTTDPELQVLVYDAAQRKIEPRNAFSSKDEDDLLKFEIIEKYLADSADVRLEVFPDRLICADCGVRLY